MFNFGGGAGPGNSGVFQGALSSTRGVTPQDMNRLIEAYKKEGRPLPNLNPAQGTNPVPLAVGLGSMGQVGNMEGMKLAHGSHKPAFTINGIPRYVGVEIDPETGEKLPRHNPAEHKGPVNPSGEEIKELRPKDEEIPLYGMPRTLSSTAFPIGNYGNKMVS